MLALLEHPLKLFWTVYFDIFRPSSFIIKNSWTVHFDTFGPYTLTFSDRSLLSFDSSGRSTFSRMTVHLDHWPFTLAQETVQFRVTVHFHPFGPSTFTPLKFVRSIYLHWLSSPLNVAPKSWSRDCLCWAWSLAFRASFSNLAISFL